MYTLTGSERMATTDAQRVRVYDLVDPALLLAHEEDFRTLLYEVVGVREEIPGVQFHINAVSGWLYFEDREFMRGDTVRASLPVHDHAARELANAFLLKLAQTLADVGRFPFLKELAGLVLLPQHFKPIEVTAIVGGNGYDAEHWLVRYETALQAWEHDRVYAPVHGAQVEVRVGEQGRIVGFCSRWPPMQRKPRLASYTPLDLEAVDKDGHSHAHADPKGTDTTASLAYSLNGDGVPQFYLAPYHSVMDGHHLKYFSASSLSLELSFAEFHNMDEMLIEARVKGGSGDYSYHWGHYLLESVWDEGVVDHPVDAPYLRISPPCYAVVLLHVLDRGSGAYAYHSAQVVGHPQYTTNEEVAV
jgi:hypothetical protein